MVFIAIILAALAIGAIVYTAVVPSKPRTDKGRVLEGKEHSEFGCSSCANKRTPLCDHCFFIQHPDGTRAKPTWYVKLDHVCLSDIMSDKGLKRDEAVKLAIQRYLDEDKPIPTALIHEHNALREKKED